MSNFLKAGKRRSEISSSNQNLKNDKSNREKVSTLISQNVKINGHRTSVRLEKEMWLGLKDIARRESCTVHDLCSVISSRKIPETSLTAAIRVFIMVYYQTASTETGHAEAGHGCGPSIAAKILERNLNTPYYGLREFKYLPPDRLQ